MSPFAPVPANNMDVLCPEAAIDTFSAPLCCAADEVRRLGNGSSGGSSISFSNAWVGEY